jgi:hypothetical protein
MPKMTLNMLSLLVLLGSHATAQTADDVQLRVGVFELATDGAEKASGGWRATGPLVIGTPTVGVFSTQDCGRFTVTLPPHAFEEKAMFGWRVEVTPTRVVDHAVTFRLRWTRALDKESSGVTPVGEDLEVTLRPGESRPIDTVPVPAGAATVDGRPCRKKSVSLRVVADFPDFDRRLIGVDAWLVERLPNGKEQSQLQSLRGLPNRPIAFYFDGVPEGAKRFDIFGKLVADPRQGTMEMAVEAIRAETAAGESGYYAARWFRSTLQLKPNETVEVALPADENTPLAKRVFSIRLRARQLR